MEKHKNRISTFSSPEDYVLPKVVSSETIIKSGYYKQKNYAKQVKLLE